MQSEHIASSSEPVLLHENGGENSPGLVGGRVTLKDVARRVGVNYSSVSMVLNGGRSNTGVSAATREKILLAAQELGYKRNSQMAAARSGRFGSVALLLSTREVVSYLPAPVMDALHDELASHNMHLSLFKVPDEELKDSSLVPKILREWMADGMIVDYTHQAPSQFVDLIEHHNLPAIWFNTRREWDCVRPDDEGAGRLMAHQLLQLGHRHVLYCDQIHYVECFQNAESVSIDHYSAWDRFHGFKSEFELGGGRVSTLVGYPPDFETNLANIKEILSGAGRPTALVHYTVSETYPVLLCARELGLKVPEDLSVVGFSGAVGFSVMGRVISSLVVPHTELGRELARLILEKIAQPTVRIATRVLPFRHFVGDTCGPVKA